MASELSMQSLFAEQAALQNIITDITITATTISVNLEPKIEARYGRPDCKDQVAVHRYDQEVITVQGLGIHEIGRAHV